ncbi:MAG: transglutaminase-like cysteine peptidase [Pseudomonadota bacterium]
MRKPMAEEHFREWAARRTLMWRGLWISFLALLGLMAISIVASPAAAHPAIVKGATGGVERRSGAAIGPLEVPIGRPVALMAESGGVRAPAGFVRFCQADPEYCRAPQQRRPGAVVSVDDALVDQLEAFNRGINARYAPGDDAALYGVADHWTFPSVYADCEDYVLAKQAALIEAGWPRESVLIGVVVGEIAPFHAVLIVRTDRGELVLDNMRDEVLDWRDTGYEWVIRQSAASPERWVRLLTDDAPAAAPIELGTTATGAR